MRVYLSCVLAVLVPCLVLAESPTQAPKPSTTTAAIAVACASKNSSCEVCVSNPQCLWCSTALQKCFPYPTGSVIPGSDICDLSNARWGLCWVNYKVLLIVMGCLAGVLIISLSCCIYCCCCRRCDKANKRKLEREELRESRQREERQSQHSERKAERQSKMDVIRQKYGLGGKENYQRFDNQDA